MKAKVLIVDDDQDIVTMLQDRLDAGGYKTLTASDGLRGIELIEQESPNLVLLDLYLPRLKGMDVLKRMAQNKQSEDIPVIVMTAAGTIPDAVEAMRHGAYDFLTKPLEKDHLLIVIQKALERDSLKRQVAALQSDVQNRYASIVGDSPKIKTIIESARRAANSDASILLLGESGTGKELFARAIHAASPRAKGPLIAVNCAGIPESLIESELFGYEKGAFTDAKRSKPGRFQLANHGTLFLDEVGELSPSAQASLLRALETRRIEPLGGVRSQPVDIRVIAATNRALPRLIQEGRFREDLYYRLNVCQLEVPPLRDRREDIAPLLQAFLDEARRQRGARLQRCTADAIALLQAYAWPGNVREVHNLVEWLTITCHETQAGVEHLPTNITAAPPKVGPTPLQNSEPLHSPMPPRLTSLHSQSDDGPLTSLLSLGLSAVELERRLIHEALERCHGNISEAARLLNMTRNTLRYRLTKHGRARASPPH